MYNLISLKTKISIKKHREHPFTAEDRVDKEKIKIFIIFDRMRHHF